jgi:glycosyltransferase involved in cell wall biosynthesis
VFKFSIITASYNRLTNLINLYDCIIKNQNFSFKIEWVVIVEKQDIKTINFLSSIYKKNITIKIIINKYPGKFNTLIKQGIKNCTGDYLIILGDDDYIKNNSLINIYNFIKKKTPQWIISPVTYHDQRRKVIRKFITKIKSKLILSNLDFLLPIVNYYMTPGVIISRNLIFRVNYFQKNLGTSNDWATWLDILSLNKPHVLKKIYFSAGYGFNTISGGLDFDKYYYLIKIILLRRFNFITKLLSFLAVVIIFFSNFFFKNITYLIALFKKQKILDEQNTIIHITRSFNKTYQTGGIEQFISQIVDKSKYTQQVISYSDTQNQYLAYKKLNLYLFKKTIKIFNDFFSFKILSFLIRQNLNYKIIHLHQPHPFSYFYILLLPFKKKIIVTYHSDILRFNFIKWIVRFIELLANRYIDLYHFSTKIYKENCQLRRVENFFIESFSINKKKIKSENIRNNLIKNLPKKYVLFIGRNRHYKGFDKLKDIILLNPHINFVCLTNYKFDFKSKNLKKINNINDDEKIYLIKNSYIHINTSDNMAESFGFSILESLSFGVPTIVFNMNSGTNYLIRNNFNGYIVDNFNINLFSKRINDLYNNSKLYKIFKRNTFLDYKKRLSHNYEILEKKYTRLLNS